MTTHEQIHCVDPTVGANLLSYGIGQLSENDRQAFEEHLLLCPACQAELEAASRVLGQISGSREELAQRLRSASAPTNRGVSMAKSRMWQVLAAAACLIGFVYWAGLSGTLERAASILEVRDSAALHTIASDTAVTTFRSDTTRYETRDEVVNYAALATKLPLAYIPVNRRGTDDSSRGEFEHAMQFYLDRDYKSAAERLSGISSDDTLNTEALLYLGISYYLSGQHRDAIRVFTRAETLKPRTTRLAQVRWYRANAKLHLGDVIGAKADLQIVQQSEAELSASAKDLLAKFP